MTTRRKFFRRLMGATTLFSLSALSQHAYAEELSDTFLQMKNMNLNQAVQDEDMWKKIQAAYAVSKSTINLNNGGVSPQPTIVLDAQKKYLQLINELPSKFLLRTFPKKRLYLRAKLAKLSGCLSEEIAIVQNTTEALNIVMMGFDWKEGDEVVLSKQDYSAAKVGWEQLAKRHKIKLIYVSLPSPVEDDEKIAQAYISKFTEKTRLVHLTQIINWTGQVIPVEPIARICELARTKNIFSLVDGAHSFGQINFKIPDLKCDAYATSLHKWLSAPIGTGMLYMKEDKIIEIWPMYPSEERNKYKIEKFENKGTISLAKQEAIHSAIEFYYNIGAQLKEARLRYLKNYWANQLKNNERIKFYTSFNDRYACAIALFDLIGSDYKDMSLKLEKKFMIHHTVSKVEGAQGIRISPNVYTKISDLDRLLDALNWLLKNS